jgi:thymidylate synthase
LVTEINRRSGTEYTTGKLIFHSKNAHIYSRLYEYVEEIIRPEEALRRQRRREEAEKR